MKVLQDVISSKKYADKYASDADEDSSEDDNDKDETHKAVEIEEDSSDAFSD